MRANETGRIHAEEIMNKNKNENGFSCMRLRAEVCVCVLARTKVCACGAYKYEMVFVGSRRMRFAEWQSPYNRTGLGGQIRRKERIFHHHAVFPGFRTYETKKKKKKKNTGQMDGTSDERIFTNDDDDDDCDENQSRSHGCRALNVVVSTFRTKS